MIVTQIPGLDTGRGMLMYAAEAQRTPGMAGRLALKTA